MERPTSPSSNTGSNIDQDNENDNSDTKSVSSSTVCTSIHSGYQVEVVPAYSQRKPSDTLFDLRKQICHPETSKKVSKKAACATFAEDDYVYSPYEQIEEPSMTLSSTVVTASSLTGTTEELNIGKLIAAKVRQAATHSMSACKKLKRKFKH